VDNFFDQVMVMAENEAVRKNRLALLSELLREFSTIADFSELGARARSEQHEVLLEQFILRGLLETSACRHGVVRISNENFL